MAPKPKETFELLGRARCDYCGKPLGGGGTVRVRRWREERNGRSANGSEVWHASCWDMSQRVDAEERALQLLSWALTRQAAA